MLTNRKWRIFLGCVAAGLGTLLWSGQTLAQGMGSGSSSGFGGSSFGSNSSMGGTSAFGGSSFGSSGFGGSGSSFGGSSFGSNGSSFGGSSFGGSSFGGSSFGSGNSGSTFSSFSGSGSSRTNSSNSGFPTVGTTNPFASYYLNPLAQGLVNTTGSSSQNEFGMPTFGTNALTTTGNTATGMVAASIGSFAPSGTPLIVPYVFNTPAATNVTPNPGGAPVSMAATPLVSEVRGILERSTALGSKPTIQVGSAGGGVIVLRGTVSDLHDARIAEGLAHLTPGVHEVRNELTLRNPPAAGNGG